MVDQVRRFKRALNQIPPEDKQRVLDLINGKVPSDNPAEEGLLHLFNLNERYARIILHEKRADIMVRHNAMLGGAFGGERVVGMEQAVDNMETLHAKLSFLVESFDYAVDTQDWRLALFVCDSYHQRLDRALQSEGAGGDPDDGVPAVRMAG